MVTFTQLLVVLDRSDRDHQVLAKAAMLSRRLGARIELFLCDAEHEYAMRHSYDARGTAESRGVCVADAMSYLSRVRASLPPDCAAVTADAACESPLYEGILHKVAQRRPDLVLKSPDCARPDCGLAFSDTDWQLASLCPAPILFVGKHEWDSTPSIAAAVDASPADRCLAGVILDAGRTLQTCLQGHLDVISCTPFAKTEGERESYTRSLHELVAALPVESERIHLLAGDPETLLPPFAAGKHYDVLVMGALAHRPSFSPTVGSLTGRLIERLDCDFLLVKPEAATHTVTSSEGRAGRALHS